MMTFISSIYACTRYRSIIGMYVPIQWQLVQANSREVQSIREIHPCLSLAFKAVVEVVVEEEVVVEVAVVGPSLLKDRER